MNKKYILLTLLLACSNENLESESELDTSVEAGEDESDVEFRVAPVFDFGEVYDQCCPHTVNGKSWDDFCAPDVNNTCPVSSGFNTGWAHHGSNVDYWTLVSCYVCSPASPNCSNKRWVANGGGWGNNCGGLAIRKMYNTLIDDDCITSSCEPNKTDPAPAEPPPTWNDLDVYENPYWIDNVLGYASNDYTQTWRYEGGSVAMCCRPALAVVGPPPPESAPDGKICVVADTLADGTATCTGGTNAYKYYSAGFVQPRWCMKCAGESGMDNFHGNWDLSYDGAWELTFSTMKLDISNPQPAAPETWLTTFECGGYLIGWDGVTDVDNCS